MPERALAPSQRRPILASPLSRGGTRRDPIAAYIATTYDLDQPETGLALLELHRLRGYGVEITEAIVDNVFARFADVVRQQAAVVAQSRHRDVPTGSVVYYMRIGNRVKIGYTTNLPGRLDALGPEELLCTEPGDRRLERERHARFSALRTHGEWFRYEAPLVDWIDQLRSA